MPNASGLENEFIKTTEKKNVSGDKARSKDITENKIDKGNITTLDQRSKSIAKESAKLKKKIKRRKIKQNYVAPEFNPFLILVISLVYMVGADGVIEDTEIQLLQNITGADKTVIDTTLRYTQNIKKDVFLSLMPSLLKPKEKICILLNLLDLMLVDGSSGEEELNYFFGLQEAFGFTDEVMKPFLNLLKLKNNKKVLGPFKQENSLNSLSSHLIYGSAMMYMLTADGVVNENEIRQLQSSIDEFKGLYEAAQKYIRANPVESFFWDIHGKVNEKQSVYILINLYDLLCTDGDIEEHEQQLFDRFLSAFKYDSARFKPFSNLIKLKNKRLRTTFDDDNEQSAQKTDEEIKNINSKGSKDNGEHHLRELTDEEKMLLLERERAKRVAAQTHESGGATKEDGEHFIESSENVNKVEHLRELTLEEQKLLQEKNNSAQNSFGETSDKLTSELGTDFVESKGIKDTTQFVPIDAHPLNLQQANVDKALSNIQDINDLEKIIAPSSLADINKEKSKNSLQQFPSESISQKNQSIASSKEKGNIQTHQEQTLGENNAKITDPNSALNIQQDADEEKAPPKNTISLDQSVSKTSNLQQVTNGDNTANLQTLNTSDSLNNKSASEQIKEQSNLQPILETNNTLPNHQPLDQNASVGTKESTEGEHKSKSNNPSVLIDSEKTTKNTQQVDEKDLIDQRISLDVDLPKQNNIQTIEPHEESSSSLVIDLDKVQNDDLYDEKGSPFQDRVNAIHSQIDTIKQKLDLVEGTNSLTDLPFADITKLSTKIPIAKEEKIETPSYKEELKKETRNSLSLDTSNLEDISSKELDELSILENLDDEYNNLLANKVDVNINPISSAKELSDTDSFEDNFPKESLDKNLKNKTEQAADKTSKSLKVNIPVKEHQVNNKAEILSNQDNQNRQPTSNQENRANQLQLNINKPLPAAIFNDLGIFGTGHQENFQSANESEVLNNLALEPKTLTIFLQPDELILNANSVIKQSRILKDEQLFLELIKEKTYEIEDTASIETLDKTKFHLIKLKGSNFFNSKVNLDKKGLINNQFKLNIVKISFAFILFSLWSLDTTAPCAEVSCERRQVGAPLQVETLPHPQIQDIIAIEPA